MPEESTTPDLVELSRRLVEAGNRHEFDSVMSFYAPDAVWEGRASGMTGEGRTAIRGFWEDWFASYEELRLEQEEVLALGNGVVFAVIMQMARLVGSSSYVRYRHALVAVWEEGLIARVTMYSDIDEARADVERLAEDRG
jgi:ketosteroid isomerase-like protein